MSKLRKIRVYFDNDSQRTAIDLTISGPSKSPESDDYFCIVESKELFRSSKKIYGANAEQAAELAIGFVRDMLRGKQLFDEDGNTVEV